MYDPVAYGRDAQPAIFAAALGDHHLPYRLRAEPAGLEVLSQLRQEAVLAHDGRDVAGGAPVHPGRASPSVAPDPRPGIHQDRRIIDEVVQIIEPTVGIVGRPLMQLGLDSQYSRLSQLGRRPRSVGIHRRPPAMPIPPCELAAPLRHVDGFPVRGLLRGLRPATTPSADDELSLGRTTRMAAGSVMAVPMFTVNRLTGSASSCAPTASPRVRRRLSSWPPWRPSPSPTESPAASLTAGARCYPAQIHQVSSRFESYGGSTTGSLALRLSVSLAGPEPSGGTGTSRRCRGCSHPTLRLQGQAAPRFTELLRQPGGGDLHPTRFSSASWRTTRFSKSRVNRAPSRANGTPSTCAPCSGQRSRLSRA